VENNVSDRNMKYMGTQK